jgi:predicted protein tyrosine phosphatase
MSYGQKILFVCSQNRLRSLTAEHLYRGFLDYEVKSVGTSKKARIPVREGHIGWADLIVVMEKKHLRLLRENFGELLNGKKIVCLNIPDIYQFMEPALIDELKARLGEHIDVPD